jgi:hypothetical protein
MAHDCQLIDEIVLLVAPCFHLSENAIGPASPVGQISGQGHNRSFLVLDRLFESGHHTGRHFSFQTIDQPIDSGVCSHNRLSPFMCVFAAPDCIFESLSDNWASRFSVRAHSHSRSEFHLIFPSPTLVTVITSQRSNVLSFRSRSHSVCWPSGSAMARLIGESSCVRHQVHVHQCVRTRRRRCEVQGLFRRSPGQD